MSTGVRRRREFHAGLSDRKSHATRKKQTASDASDSGRLLFGVDFVAIEFEFVTI